MHFIEHFYIKTLKHDLSNKFFYKDTKKIPKIKKIVLNFGCRIPEIKHLAASLLALELITSKKGKLTTTKRSNILLKIRKGNPVGCKVVLTKKQMFKFLEKIIINIFPNIKNFTGVKLNNNKTVKTKTFSFEIQDIFTFTELEEQYYLFNNLPNLTITIITNSKSNKELLFIIKSLQFSLK